MRTIAILNLKGGTAKTVTAATMGRCLAADHNKAVLLIDADQQGNLSQYFGVKNVGSYGNTWKLLTEGTGYYPQFLTELGPNLEMIPADMDLARADLPNSGAKVTAINDLREVLEADEAFDYCIIDLPPSLGLPIQAALLAADEVIIPIRLDLFSTAGMAELIRQVDSMREINPRLRVAGILGTQYQRTPEEREIHRLLLVESGLPVYRTLIRQSPPVPRSIAMRTSVLTLSPNCGASRDYRAFVREYLAGKEGQI